VVQARDFAREYYLLEAPRFVFRLSLTSDSRDLASSVAVSPVDSFVQTKQKVARVLQEIAGNA
jgi:hypothetical protein